MKRRAVGMVAVAFLLMGACAGDDFGGEQAERWCLRWNNLMRAMDEANDGSESAARSLGSILDGLEELSPGSIKDDIAVTRATASLIASSAGVDLDLDTPAEPLTLEDTRLALNHLGEFADEHGC